MRTVKQVSRESGVSVRTLQYYDRIGLLRPTEHTAAGYRLYDDTAMERLQQILLFRELEFPLREIRRILADPGFDRAKALEQQITLLTLKKERLEGLISLARRIQTTGGKTMDFSAFDTEKIDAYTAQAKERWGDTAAWREYEEKAAGRTKEEESGMTEGLMRLFAEFGAMRTASPSAPEAQAQVKKLQDYITAHFYTCTGKILAGLGEMYSADPSFAESIDKAGGAGTAAFATEAIRVYCRDK